MNALLLQIDPGKAIEAADKLAVGNAQTILAYVAVFSVLGGVAAVVWLGRKLFTEVKSCSAERREELLKAADSYNNLARAIEGSTQATRAALEAARGRP